MLKVNKNTSWLLETYESVAEIVASCVAQQNQHYVQRLLGNRLYQTIFEHIDYMYSSIDLSKVVKIRVLCENIRNKSNEYISESMNELGIISTTRKNIQMYNETLNHVTSYIKRESPVKHPSTMYIKFNDVILLMIDTDDYVIGMVNIVNDADNTTVTTRCIQPGDIMFDWNN